MSVNSGNFPKAMQPKGATMKPTKKSTKTLANIMKQDSKLDKAMTPAMMKKDIAADRKMLASKTSKGKPKK